VYYNIIIFPASPPYAQSGLRSVFTRRFLGEVRFLAFNKYVDCYTVYRVNEPGRGFWEKVSFYEEVFGRSSLFSIQQI